MWWAVGLLAFFSSGIIYLYQLLGNNVYHPPTIRSKLLLKDPKESLKILLIVEPTPFGYTSGYSNRFKEMLQNIKDCGDQVYILTPDDSPNPPTEYMGYPINTLTGFRLIFYDHVMLSIDWEGQIDKVIKEFHPDVIHVSTPGTVLFPAIYYARKNRIPLLMSYHTHLPMYAKIYLPIPGSVAFAEFLLYSLLNLADLTLVTSPQLKEQVQNVGVNRVGIWQKGINTEKFSPSFRNNELRKKLADGNESKILLLYVGRLGAEKNLKVLQQVLRKIPNTRLILVGNGPYESELKRFFRDDDVLFTGKIEGQELSEMFASCDIFVMPSETETLGFVVLEAMASGTPVVAIGANGILDIITHGQTGLLAQPSNSIQEIVDNVQLLVENPILRQNISQQGREWAEQWNWKAATEKLRTSQYRAAISLHHIRHHRILDNANSPTTSSISELFPLFHHLFFVHLWKYTNENILKGEMEIMRKYSV